MRQVRDGDGQGLRPQDQEMQMGMSEMREDQVSEFRPRPGSIWLVVYECRYDVVRVSADGKGFFAPGQEPLWGLNNVTEWVREIVLPIDDDDE